MQIVTDTLADLHKTPLQRIADRAAQEASMNHATEWILQQDIPDARKVELCRRVQNIARWLPRNVSIYAVVASDPDYSDLIKQRNAHLSIVGADLAAIWQEAESAKLPTPPQPEPDPLEWNPTDGEIQDMM